jgi:Family of unknown function (DUF6492)
MRLQNNMDLVTVVYRDELELLKTQAYSISYYFVDEIQNIYVILNDDTLSHSDIETFWWGYHQDKVSIFHRNEFGYYPSPHLKGWYTQQVCKILGTAHAESNWCMILDAKTWFIRPFETSEVFDQYNRARFMNWICNNPHWQSGLEFLKQKYNITDFKWISPAGVPFLAYTHAMRDMVMDEPNFVEWFESNCQFPSSANHNTHGITEFLCYSAWISKNNLFKDLYSNEQFIEVANLADYDVPNFNVWWKKVHKENTLTASVHPRAYKLLDKDQRRAWDEFVKERI